jgi:hypothetical protein
MFAAIREWSSEWAGLIGTLCAGLSIGILLALIVNSSDKRSAAFDDNLAKYHCRAVASDHGHAIYQVRRREVFFTAMKPTGLILPAGSPKVEYPTHKSLFRVECGRVVAVMDCFSGLTLRCFDCRRTVGEIVQTGPIGKKLGEEQVATKFWVVIGFASWHKARAMADRCSGPRRSLFPGVWHEVFSE